MQTVGQGTTVFHDYDNAGNAPSHVLHTSKRVTFLMRGSGNTIANFQTAFLKLAVFIGFDYEYNTTLGSGDVVFQSDTNTGGGPFDQAGPASYNNLVGPCGDTYTIGASASGGNAVIQPFWS